MALVLLLLLLLACLNSLDDLFFDLKVFGIQEHLFCGKLNEVTAQIFKRSVIFKSDLNQKFDFNFNSCFIFILKEDLLTVLVSVYKAAVEKAINYQLINCYFIFFTFNQQNLQNLATKEQI